MNKADLIRSMSEKTNLTKKDLDKVIKAFLKTITETLAKGEKIQLVGFGTFETKKRAARKGRNPRNGKEIKIAAKRVPVFKAGKALRNLV